MKVKHYEHLFLHWFSYFFAILAVISLTTAQADTVPPPQTVQQAIAQTPTNRNFTINVHDGTGTYKNPNFTVNFNTDQGKTKQFGSISTPLSDPLKGGKNLNVVIKDPYGNAATGKINTQTTMPQTSTLNNIATGYLVGAITGSIINSPHATQAAQNIAQGNYGQAAAHAAASADVFGIGGGIYNLFNAYQETKAAINEPIRQAAQTKANSAYEKYYGTSELARQKAIEEARANGGTMYSMTLEEYKKKPVHIGVFSSKPLGSAMFIYDGKTGEFFTQTHGDKSMRKYAPDKVSALPGGGTPWVSLNWKQVSTNDIAAMDTFSVTQEEILNDFLLNQAEIQAIIANTLNQMLNNQQENTAAIKDLINLLWANNQLNPSNTQTTVTGSTADNTFLTAPYTPQGSNQAQQTQFIVNPDGTITTSIIPRPDLAANTSQAPTRQPIINQSTQGNAQNTQNTEQATPEQPDICKLNPNSVMCADMGNVDYEDVVLPNEQLDLEFKPSDFFEQNGTCPAPKPITFHGNTYFLSYEPMCDFATGARPMIILLGMVIAMSMVYATVKEL